MRIPASNQSNGQESLNFQLVSGSHDSKLLILFVAIAQMRLIALKRCANYSAATTWLKSGFISYKDVN